MRKPIAIATALAALAGAVGCGGDDAGAGSGSEPAVALAATTTHVADLARHVGGEPVAVIALLPPSADPHGYEPAPSDARAVAESDLVVRSGGDLDAWLDELTESAGGGRNVLTLIDHVATIEGGGEPHEENAGEEDAGHGGVDPHWWQDPKNAQAAVREIRDRLTAVDPGGRRTYEDNAESYIERLEQLDRGIAECMSRVPAEERKLVTTHDALGYYAAAYDLDVIGAAIPSLSTQAQPSAGDTAELVRQIEEEGVNAVFSESGVNPKIERAIAEEAGAEVGGELWADTLGPKGSSGETYIEALAADTETLVQGMSGGRVSCRPGA